MRPTTRCDVNSTDGGLVEGADRKLYAEDRKVVLMLDYAPVHPNITLKMQFLVVFALSLTFFDGADTYNSSSLTPHLRNILQELCPGVGICRENKTSEVPPKTFMSGFESCCTECSCGPECQAGGNCCYPESVPMLPADYRATHMKSECLFPSTHQPSPEERFLFKSYYMISSVPNESVDEVKSKPNISCGEEKVAPWGSLQPVYSAKQEKIYKNIACAIADGVDDGKLWTVSLQCINNDGLHLDVATYVLGLESDSMYEYCQIHFSYDGDTENIQRHQCYTDLVDRCKSTDFQVPGRIETTKEEVIEACTNGPLSPYRHTTMFANVFCLICNVLYFPGDGKCPVYSDELSRTQRMTGFISLIDTNFIQEHLRYPHHLLEDLKACTMKDSNPQQNDCRRVFCPSGKLHDQSGRCNYPSTLWLNQEYTLFISLTSEQDININKVLKPQQNDLFERVLDLKSPWQKQWAISSIFYEDTGKGNSTTNLLVVLTHTLSQVKPEQLVKYIKNMVKRDWILKHRDATITLKSSLFKYTDCGLGVHSQVEKVVIGNQSIIAPFPPYHNVYSTLYAVGNTHVVTKMYWCDQVELQASEFILNSEKTLLLNLITSRILHCGEFVLVASNTLEGNRVRVCIEDSGFYLTDDQVISFGGSRYKIYSGVWLLVFLCICCVSHII